MDAPKCKTCGVRHYGVCRSFKIQPVIPAPKPYASTFPTKPGPPEQTDTKLIVELTQRLEKAIQIIESLPKLERKHFGSDNEIVGAFAKEAFDRKAYQREYMRKRRAAEKAKAKPS